MKSPFTGKEMQRVYEKRIWNFRGEQYEYEHSSWFCSDSGESFTDDLSDTAGFVQVTNQYRDKYGIPYTDEIISIRNKYDISAAKMSLILGIGVNQYRKYEQGEVPSVSNGRMIRSVSNPKVMLEMVESSKNEMSQSEYEKIANKVKSIIADSDSYKLEQYEIKRIFSTLRSKENGYAQLSLDRLKNVMLYVLERCDDVWCTKMNKLLFYVDFLSYRDSGMAITGLSYRAVDFGPVPERWEKVYSEFPEVHQEFRQAGDFEGSVLIATQNADVSLFTDFELQVMDKVCSLLGKKSSRELSRISHEEKAWKEYCNNHEKIPFNEAFSICAVSPF
jgi:putative zinc finger/helix-turn-helix YgiT family protein